MSVRYFTRWPVSPDPWRHFFKNVFSSSRCVLTVMYMVLARNCDLSEDSQKSPQNKGVIQCKVLIMRLRYLDLGYYYFRSVWVDSISRQHFVPPQASFWRPSPPPHSHQDVSLCSKRCLFGFPAETDFCFYTFVTQFLIFSCQEVVAL